jgi:hypothetical protein
MGFMFQKRRLSKGDLTTIVIHGQNTHSTDDNYWVEACAYYSFILIGIYESRMMQGTSHVEVNDVVKLV